MTSILSIDRVAGFNDWRNGIVSSLGDLSQLGNTEWDIIKNIECFPGSRIGDDTITVPEDWLPVGITRRLSHRTVNMAVFRQADPVSKSQQRWDESFRRSVLALWLPRLTHSGLRTYKPSSWLSAVQHLMRAAKWQLQERPHPDGLLWSHLEIRDFLAMQAAVSDSEQNRNLVRRIVRWLSSAGERGLLIDAPLLFKGSVASGPFGPSLERSQKGPAPARAEKVEERNFQPFPDEYVTQMMWRARWLHENLAYQLLSCWNEQRAIVARFAGRGIRSSNPTVIDARRNAIASIDWRDGNGQIIERLPFTIAHKFGQHFQYSDAWPPTTGRTVSVLVGTLQALNLCTVAFCTGARAGEIASATDESLVYGPRGNNEPRLLARTFKLESSLGGTFRDWPLHPVAARALEIQKVLAQSVRREGDRHLWVHHGMAGEKPLGSPLLDITRQLVAATQHLGLTEIAGNSHPHAHRWRHTIARIVALSVVGSPQVLLDLFGHRDLEMTLRYMLSHPEIAEEAQKVARETAFAFSEEAIAETMNGLAGGPAAKSLMSGLEDLRMRRGDHVYGADSLRELTEVLTFGGKHWQIVRPGVICTKAPGQFGPCTQGRGAPDPGSCRTNCDHRLETTRAKSHCSATIEVLIGELAHAQVCEHNMIVANLKGQLIAQLQRWDDIRIEWLGRSDTAKWAWNGRSQ